MDDRLLRLGKLLGTMDVPDSRRFVFSRSDLRWLGRNLHIRNGSHPDIQTARKLIVSLLKEGKLNNP